MTQEMRAPAARPGDREDIHAKLDIRENSQRPYARQELIVAEISKNSRARFEVALRHRTDGSVRVELRVREQNPMREWKDYARAISINPELAATQIAEAFIRARDIADALSKVARR